MRTLNEAIKLTSVKLTLIVMLLLSVSTVMAAEAAPVNSPASQNSAIQELLAQRNKEMQTSSQAQAPQSPSVSPSSSIDSSQAKAFGATPASRQAFSNLLKNVMPLSTTQIKTLQGMFDTTRRTIATYPGKPPRPTSTTVMVDLSPGATPPVIRLRAGFISSLVLLDSTGQPWPIQAYDNGNPQSFNIKWDQKSNPGTLLVQSSGSYMPANLVVLLKGKTTPVILTLLSGQAAVDYRVDLRIPGLGPNARPVFSNLPQQANPMLINVLDGIPPSGSKRLAIQGGNAQAWLVGRFVYLRTHLTLLSPSWVSTMSSPDGTHAYQIMRTPVVLMSDKGRMARLTIQGI